MSEYLCPSVLSVAKDRPPVLPLSGRCRNSRHLGDKPPRKRYDPASMKEDQSSHAKADRQAGMRAENCAKSPSISGLFRPKLRFSVPKKLPANLPFISLFARRPSSTLFGVLSMSDGPLPTTGFDIFTPHPPAFPGYSATNRAKKPPTAPPTAPTTQPLLLYVFW